MIGEHLKSWRTKKKLTLRELSEKAGLSHSFISKVERNEHTPNRENIKTICKSLGISTEEINQILIMAGYVPEDYDLKESIGLAALFPPEPTLDEVSKEILDELNKLGTKEKEEILSFIKFKHQQLLK